MQHFFDFLRRKPQLPSVNELLQQNALILDVRTPGEFAEGHLEGSTNIPLNELKARIPEIEAMHRPVVACCRSGNRSGMAARMLRGKGIVAVNGGSWQQVAREVKD